MDTRTSKIEARKQFLINAAYFAVIGALIYFGLKYVLGLVLPFLLAFCIVSIVHPLIGFLNRKMKIRHAVISIAVMALVYILVGAAIFGIILLIVNLLQQLFQQIQVHYSEAIMPGLMQAWQNILNFASRFATQEWLEQIIDWQMMDWQAIIMDYIPSILGSVSDRGIEAVRMFTDRVPAFFIAFVFTILLSFFISIQYNQVIQFFREQLPEKANRVFRDLKIIIIDTVFNYIKACMKLMMITFVELSIGLLILGTGSAVLIAAGIAVFDALPIFGTGAVMVPWIIVEFIRGNVSYSLGLLFLYGIVTIVRNIIEPKIIGDKLGLNPIVSVASIYIGFKLMSIVGMIIMPILTQILLELHKKGSISLLRRKAMDVVDETKGDEGVQ